MRTASMHHQATHWTAGMLDEDALPVLLAHHACRPSAADQPTASASCIAGHVACPVCGKTLPEAFLNIHLDECLQQEQRPAKAPVPAAVDLTREPVPELKVCSSRCNCVHMHTCRCQPRRRFA